MINFYLGDQIKLKSNKNIRGIIYEITPKIKADLVDKDFKIFLWGIELDPGEITNCNYREIGDQLFWEKYWLEIEEHYK